MDVFSSVVEKLLGDIQTNSRRSTLFHIHKLWAAVLRAKLIKTRNSSQDENTQTWHFLIYDNIVHVQPPS